VRQTAPDSVVLHNLVERLGYKDGWRFRLDDIDRGQGSEGLTLVINIHAANSYHPDRSVSVNHYMIVPPAAYDARSWRRWLLEQILLVESHEACEFFRIGGEHPYAPSHGPGNDPYIIREMGTAADAETNFRGVRNGPPPPDVRAE
jgi:hypothetical protein